MLAPRDVLYVAWTSKAFYDVLTRRSSKSVWKSARANISDLPPCPNDLSEFAYARLMFDSHCQVCFICLLIMSIYI